VVACPTGGLDDNIRRRLRAPCRGALRDPQGPRAEASVVAPEIGLSQAWRSGPSTASDPGHLSRGSSGTRRPVSSGALARQVAGLFVPGPGPPRHGLRSRSGHRLLEARLCRRAGGKHFLRLAGLLVGQPPAASPEIASWCRVQRAQRGAWRRPGAVTGAGAQWGGCDRFRDRNVSGSHDPQRRARRRRRDPQTDHGKQDSTAGMRLGSSRLAELRGRGCDQDVGASPSTSAKVCCAMRNAVLAAGTPQ
jgi:hypothetical protein